MSAAIFGDAESVYHAGIEIGRVVMAGQTIWRLDGWQPEIPVTAEAACIVRADTGAGVWAKAATTQLLQASTTKIMTVHLVLQILGHSYDLGETIEFVAAYEGSGSGDNLQAGDVISWQDAIYNALLPSSNETCDMLAAEIGRILLADSGASASSAIARFVTEMNAEAGRLGLADTNYLNPHGMTSDTAHHTSAADLAALTVTAITDPRFAASWSLPSASLTVTGPNARSIAVTHSVPMITDPDVTGAKSGTTSAAGAWVALTAETDDGTPIVVVVAKSTTENRYTDARRMIAMAQV